jgi:phosphatidylethanolamine N-methyltransferase
VDRPAGLDFKSIRQWLLKIVNLALDSDPSLIPKSTQTASPPLENATHVHSPSHSLDGSSSSSSSTAGSRSSHATPPIPFDPHEDDFRFWSEKQAKRISYAISQVLSIEFAPEVIVADANVTALTRRILASKELLGP